jgi:uncharacterized protein
MYSFRQKVDQVAAESLGGKILMPKTEIPHVGWWAAFADPTGNRIALYTSMGH